MQVEEYNKACKRYPLPTYGRKNAVGVIVGSTKAFWPFFEKYVRSFKDPETLPKDPIDAFHEHVVSETLKSREVLANTEWEARYDWNSPRSGRFVHVQTAGHLAGFAFYDQDVFWSAHPVFGFWFVYRAVVVFNCEWEGPLPALPLPVLSHDVKLQIVSLTQIANDERWQNRLTRLQIRDSCPIGRDLYRYEGECFKYFFPIDEPSLSVIDRIRNASSSSSSSDTSSSADCASSNTPSLPINS